jgi:hypothetical protein
VKNQSTRFDQKVTVGEMNLKMIYCQIPHKKKKTEHFFGESNSECIGFVKSRVLNVNVIIYE